jgi:hypothetical protein
LLRESAELDAETFFASSVKLRQDILGETVPTATVISIRESVRKPMPKGGAQVNVKVSVEIRHLAEKLAHDLGMNPDDLIADAEKIAAGAWSNQ